MIKNINIKQKLSNMGWLFTLLFILCNIDGLAQQPSFELLKKHVYVLASDSMAGRATGETGQKMAAKYIANQFKASGIEPLNGHSYYHKYLLKKKRKNFVAVQSKANYLVWPWHFYFVSSFNQNDTLNKKLVFAGFGSIDEARSINIENKAVAFISKNPKEAYQNILKLKEEFGNRTYFVMLPHKNEMLDKAWRDEYYTSLFALPEKFEQNMDNQINEPWNKPYKADSLTIFYCFNDVLRNFFMLSDNQLEKAAKENRTADENRLSNIIQPEISCIIDYKDTVVTKKVENVGGIIPGAQNDETIVVTAHYDHLGVEMGETYYGADDNASGTSVLLETARILAEKVNAGGSLRRNVMFLAFSGEEMGLLGSKAYVENPVLPLEQTVLNINMDMVGRWDSKHETNRNFVYLLTEGDKSRKLFRIGKHKLDLPPDFNISRRPGAYEKRVFTFGSDHYNFYQKDIPVAVVFTGLHDDYHTPLDTPEKLNYENLVNITDFVQQFITKIANSNKLYKPNNE